MTLEQLREQIKDEIILHNGELAPWQWQQMGLTKEAEELGISGTDFMKIVNEVSQHIYPSFGKISDLRIDIEKKAGATKKKLTDADVETFVASAERVHLTRQFVVEKWIPAIYQTIPDPEPPAPEPVSEPVPVPPTPPPATPSPTSRPATLAVIRKKIAQQLTTSEKYLSGQSLRIFMSNLDADPALVADEVLRHLSAHFFASETAPTGRTLAEKLISTNWRHLSWWDRGQRIVGFAPTNSSFQPVRVEEFRASARQVSKGSTITLTWRVSGSPHVTILGVGRMLPSSGIRDVVVSQSFTFTLHDHQGSRLRELKVIAS